MNHSSLNSKHNETTDIKTRPVGCIPRIGNAARNDDDGTHFAEQFGLCHWHALLYVVNRAVVRTASRQHRQRGGCKKKFLCLHCLFRFIVLHVDVLVGRAAVAPSVDRVSASHRVALHKHPVLLQHDDPHRRFLVVFTFHTFLILLIKLYTHKQGGTLQPSVEDRSVPYAALRAEAQSSCLLSGLGGCSRSALRRPPRARPSAAKRQAAKESGAICEGERGHGGNLYF